MFKLPNIIYSDIVLPASDIGASVQVTCIDITKSNLDTCVKMIMESNPNVSFYTILYSDSEKKVHFYTDKQVSTKYWEDSVINSYKLMDSDSKILEEIKNIYCLDDNSSNDYISLYDVAMLINKVNNDYNMFKKECELQFSNIISSIYDKACYIKIKNFDYKEKELTISFSIGLGNAEKVIFSKNDERLYIKESKSPHAFYISELLRDELSDFYNKVMDYSAFYEQYVHYLKSISSNFLININSNGVSIFAISQTKPLNKFFEVSSFNNEYIYNCDSHIIIDSIKGNESEIFKKIFIKIEDCPKWSQNELYKIRKEQLEEMIIQEEKEKRKLERQNRLQKVKRLLFSFTKK